MVQGGRLTLAFFAFRTVHWRPKIRASKILVLGPGFLSNFRVLTPNTDHKFTDQTGCKVRDRVLRRDVADEKD
jgi:hypothetical protein